MGRIILVLAIIYTADTAILKCSSDGIAGGGRFFTFVAIYAAWTVIREAIIVLVIYSRKPAFAYFLIITEAILDRSSLR